MPAKSPKTPPTLLKKSMTVCRRVLRSAWKLSSANLNENCEKLANLKLNICFSINVKRLHHRLLDSVQLWFPNFDVVADRIAKRQAWTRAQHSRRLVIFEVMPEKFLARKVVSCDATDFGVGVSNDVERNAFTNFLRKIRKALDFTVSLCVDFEESQFPFAVKVTWSIRRI